MGKLFALPSNVRLERKCPTSEDALAYCRTVKFFIVTSPGEKSRLNVEIKFDDVKHLQD
jgi:hypothetical protein